MTLPDERTRSIESAREFLRDLLDPAKTPKVPKAIRRRAYACLRHFPHDYELKKAFQKVPELFGPMEETSDDLSPAE